MSFPESGFLCVIRNYIIPNFLRINISYENPEDYLKKINNENKLPKSYFILYCKYINNPKYTLKNLYEKLKKYRVNYKNDYFRINFNNIESLFIKIYGREYKTIKKSNREMKLCFYTGQQIRHKINDNIIIGTYSYNNNNIVYKDKIFTSPSGFSKYHYKMNRKDRNSSSNGWKECEIFQNNKWISIYNL